MSGLNQLAGSSWGNILSPHPGCHCCSGLWTRTAPAGRAVTSSVEGAKTRTMTPNSPAPSRRHVFDPVFLSFFFF